MDQVDLFDAKGNKPTTDPDAFGCCSAYRECSEAGKCIKPDMSEHCLYAKNLAEGKIFYGEAANDFSAERYEEICKKADALSEGARKELDELLVVFCEYWRGIQEYVVRNRHIEELESVGLFSFEPLRGRFPPYREERWKADVIRSEVMSDDKFGPMFKSAQDARKDERAKILTTLQDNLSKAKERKDKKEADRISDEIDRINRELPGERTKTFLRRWLQKEGAELRDRMAEPYRMAAYQSKDAFLYAEELYRDTLMQTLDARVYRLSPFAEDGLLTDAVFSEEEERRKRFSRGYHAQKEA